MSHNFGKQPDGSKFCSWCGDEKYADLERECPRSQVVHVDLVTKEPSADSVPQLHDLLVQGGLALHNIQESVVSRMKERFTSRVTLCLLERDASLAKRIYDWAVDLPLTATCVELANEEIIVNGCVYGDNVKLQVCFYKGKPSVLKTVPRAEYDRALALKDAGVQHPHLVEQVPCLMHGKHFNIMPLLPITSTHLCGIPLTKAVELWEQVGSALECLHAHSFVHKDVKSDNVAMDHEGKFILIDLGDTVPVGNIFANSTAIFVPCDLDGTGAANTDLDWGMLMMTVYDRMQPSGAGLSFSVPELTTKDLLQWFRDKGYKELAGKMAEKFKGKEA